MDILEEAIGRDAIDKLMKSNQLITMPIGYMRGVTFKESFVILDEAQNTTVEQIRLFLTRIGPNSKMVITGDTRQSDLDKQNGFEIALEKLKNIEGIGNIYLDKHSIVRHPIISKIEEAFES